MAKRKYISDFERDVIRIGHANGVSCTQIAKFCGRNRVTIWNHIRAMTDDGTITQLPFGFVVDEVAEAMRNAR